MMQRTVRIGVPCRRVIAILTAACVVAGVGTGLGQDGPAVPRGFRLASTRPFILSASPMQNGPGEEPFSRLAHPPQYSFADLAPDVDVLGVFVEHYGVPWPQFVAAETPPADHVWTRTMRELATAALATGKPVSLQMVLSRDRIAGLARQTSSGTIEVDSNWAPPCYDFGANQAHATAYGRYVRWMVREFKPRYVNVAVEIDKAWRACIGPRWEAMVDAQRLAYDAAKTEAPAVIAMISVNAEDLYGQTVDGFDETAYKALARLKRDRFGLSTYPSGLKGSGGQPLRPEELPVDYFVRTRLRHPDEAPIAVAETGWNSQPLKLGTPEACVVVVSSSEAVQAAYVDVLLTAARAQRLELVTWFSQRDVLPAVVMDSCYARAAAPTYAACHGDVWCLGVNIYRQIAPADLMVGDLVFKGFGSMGLARYDGVPKPALKRWREQLAVPVQR